MACGKALVATDRGGPRESVINGETGRLCRDDAGAFVSAFETLSHMPDRAPDELAVGAPQRTLCFPWDEFVDRIDGNVEEIAAAKSEVMTARATGTVEG
jgi:glycosyltransferase involved in cell wall biosynthesis